MRRVLHLEDVWLTYQAENGEITALESFSFSGFEGEQIAIVGPSGCGKSTLLSVIAGLEPPTRGKVFLDDTQVTGVSPKIGYMLQKDNLLNWRTIGSNVMLGLEIRGMLTSENRAYAYGLLDTYGLSAFVDKYPSQLSGGMRQRAALIRTLATRPELLLLDEAFSALDYQTRLTVTDDVYSILKGVGKTAVIVTHDIPEAISMADRILVVTHRPGRVKSVHKINLTDKDGKALPPTKRRAHPGFTHYFNTIWKELDLNE